MAGRPLRHAAAAAGTIVAALHLFYAVMGGIAETAGARWSLAFLTVVGSALVWTAALRGPWSLAWAGMVLLALPAALAWPATGVSAGGLLALALLTVTLLLLAFATARPKAVPA